MPSKITLLDDSAPNLDLKRHSSIDTNNEQHASVHRTAFAGEQREESPKLRSIAKHLAAEASFRRLTAKSRQEYFSRDIRGSSRLVGYTFCAICCVVLFVSAILFKFTFSPDDLGSREYYVVPWKELATIAFSAVGFGLSFVIVLCHFDATFLPNYWSSVFKDGSKKERRIIVTLIIYWLFALWTCTGVYSVGELQLNVFFSTWLAFFALFVTLDEWRKGAVSPLE